MRLKNHLLLGFASLAALGAATTTTTTTAESTSSTTTGSTSSQGSTSPHGSTSTHSSTSASSSPTSASGSTSSTGSASSTGSTSMVEPTTTTTLTRTSVTTVTVSRSTTTSTASASTSTGGSSTRTVVMGDLTPENAQATTVAGPQPAFEMNATPGSRSALIGSASPPSGALPGDLIKLSANVIVTTRSTGATKRQDDGLLVSGNTSCDLLMTINGETVYNRTLVLNGGVGQRIESDAVPSTNPAELAIVQTCRAGRLATLVIYNIALELVRGTPPSSTTLTTTLTTTQTVSNSTMSTTTSSVPNTTITTTARPTTTGFPEFSNRFRFLGCVESSENYPTFFLAAEEDDMTIGRCTEVCRGFDYAGVHDTGCYCGRAFDGTRTRIVPATKCNIPCPGNKAEFCGGNLLLERGLSRRQNPVPNNLLLTLYVAISIIPPPITITTTETGKPHPSHVVCHDGRCDPVVIILKPHRGEDCRDEIVFEKVICDGCDYEHNWEPTRCEGKRCDGRVVYKPEECTRNCDEEIIVIERHCSKCEGGVIYKDQVIVIPPHTIHRNHTKAHTVTRHKTHSWSRTVTHHHTRSKDHTTVTLTASPSTVTTTVTPTISLTTSLTTSVSGSASSTSFTSSTSSTSSSDSASISTPPSTSTSSSSSTSPSPSSSSEGGDPNNRVIIDDPTETTAATATQTSPVTTETGHVIVSGGERTVASMLSAVMGLLLFL